MAKSSKKPTVSNPEVTKNKNIKNEVANPAALAPLPPLDANNLTYPQAVSIAKEYIRTGLQAYTAAVALKDLQPEQVVSLHDYGATLVDAVEEAKKIARARVLDIALRLGQPVGDKGLSRELRLGGVVQRITIQKSGVDPKKFEAALRAKQATLTKYMEQVVTYKHSATGVQAALDDGIFTADELKAMEYEPTYRVERSKEANSAD